jgi:hypothetical protein
LSDAVDILYFLKDGDWELKIDIQEIDALVKGYTSYINMLCFSLNSSMVPFTTINVRPSPKVKEIEILLEDKNLKTRRQIMMNRMSNEGPLLSNSNTKGVLNLYTVELHEEVFVKEDLTKNCIDYPTDQFESYDDCDWQYCRSRLTQEIGPDFMPLWAADNISSVTAEPVLLTEKGLNTHINLVNGLQLSDCKLPCKIMKTQSKYQGSVTTAYEGVSVSFKEDIQVTTTTFVPFDPVKFLCDIGGMLGLWLGLGAVQLAAGIMTTLKLAFKKFDRSGK